MRLISVSMRPILATTMPVCSARHLCRGAFTLGATLLLANGCKAPRSEAPGANLDNIAAIESELTSNEARLQAQGVALPRTAAQAAEDDAGGDAAAGPVDIVPAEPVAPPPEPEPEPTPAADADEEMAPAARDEVSVRSRERVSRKRGKRAPRSRCERICDLTESTCELADRICGLANEHVDDVRYEEACDRAEAQCEAASDACSDCEE